MNARDYIKTELKRILVDLLDPNGAPIDPELEIPENYSFGDFSTNVAMQVFKLFKTNIPGVYGHARAAKASSAIDMANKIKDSVKLGKVISRVEVKPPGFVNFWLANDYLVSLLDKELKLHRSLEGKKFIIEFSDPNPFKEFHIGHVYSTIVGESISRLLESQGSKVVRTVYHGDVGIHIAKAIWGWMELDKNSKSSHPWKTMNYVAKVQYLGLAYVTGAKAFEEDKKAKAKIIILNKKIYERSNQNVNSMYDEGKKVSLKYFDEIYQMLGTTFDERFFESEVGSIGLEKIKEYKKFFKESEQAIIFEGKNYGLHNRVFVNSQGFPTYEAKELGLAFAKDKKFHTYDKSIIITGNEIVEYFKVVMAVLKLINKKIEEKTKHISHGMVRLEGGKISSRLKNFITWYDILKFAAAEEFRLSMEAGVKINDANEIKIGEHSVRKDIDYGKSRKQVTLGGIKYALLKNRLGQDMEFNFATSIPLSGDSAPYIQYAYVRTRSVLANSDSGVLSERENRILNDEEILLLRTISKFSDVVEKAALEYSPSVLCLYLLNLAQKFNSLYEKHQISNNSQRLKITALTAKILSEGLSFLGIEAPQGM